MRKLEEVMWKAKSQPDYNYQSKNNNNNNNNNKNYGTTRQILSLIITP